jgi:RND superfamily putative drug exporter
MEALTDWVLRHRRLVVAAWAVLTVVAYASLPAATGALSEEFNLPGQEGPDTNAAIFERYGNGGPFAPSPLVPVITVPEGRTVDEPALAAQITDAFAAVAAANPGSRFADFATTGDEVFVSEDRRTTFAVLYVRPGSAFDPITAGLEASRAAVEEVEIAGRRIDVTGLEVLRAGSEGEAGGPEVLVEVLIGGAIALVILIAVFGSPLAFVPVLMAAIAIPMTFLAIWPLAELTEVSFIVQFLVALIGLGVAIDYALLIVNRWREELAKGHDNEEAVRRSMSRAGRAVVFSGIAVAIGLLALIVLPVPFLRSIGIAGMLIPVMSVVVAVTLLPVILATIGPRLQRYSLPWSRSVERHGWERWARFVIRRRWLVGGAALLLLLGLLFAATGLNIGEPRGESLATAGEAREGYDQLVAGDLDGVLSPMEVLVVAGDPDLTGETLADVDEVIGAIAPTDPSWRVGDSAIVNAFPSEEGSTGAAREAIDNAREAAAELPGTVTIGGNSAGSVDFIEAVYGNFPLMVAIILVITFVMLTRIFRSPLLALKAVVFNLISVGAVWGFLVLFWQEGGGGELFFDIPSTGSVTVWVPLMLFAFLYGLSMDYEVFILSRIRETYDATGDTDEAVVAGIANTGRLVTAASLILFGAFVVLASGPQTEVKVFATGLAVGIVLDATVVRGMLLPAFVSLFGSWNWWMPDWLARVMRVPQTPSYH